MMLWCTGGPPSSSQRILTRRRGRVFPCGSFAGEPSPITGRRLDQGARRPVGRLPRLVSLQVKISLAQERNIAAPPACARDQVGDEAIRIGGLRNHPPAPIATTSVSPCSTKPSASAANSQLSEPVNRSASHPPPMATTMRRKPADSGQNNRPAPCDAK